MPSRCLPDAFPMLSDAFPMPSRRLPDAFWRLPDCFPMPSRCLPMPVSSAFPIPSRCLDDPFPILYLSNPFLTPLHESLPNDFFFPTLSCLEMRHRKGIGKHSIGIYRNLKTAAFEGPTPPKHRKGVGKSEYSTNKNCRYTRKNGWTPQNAALALVCADLNTLQKLVAPGMGPAIMQWMLLCFQALFMAKSVVKRYSQYVILLAILLYFFCSRIFLMRVCLILPFLLHWTHGNSVFCPDAF